MTALDTRPADTPRHTETTGWRELLADEHYRSIAATQLWIRADQLALDDGRTPPHYSPEERADDAVAALLMDLAQALGRAG